MSKEEAIQVVQTALVSYVQDCSGHGTEETNELEQAWELIKDSIPENEL